MKKILSFIAPFVLFSTLSAQITQQGADSIVQERLNDETKPHVIYAKEEVQTEGYTVTTATGEILDLEYPAWIYFVNYTEETNGKYLIVKENSGNLLEINTQKDNGPEDLAEWRIVTFEPEPEYPIEIPFTEYSLAGTSCQWINLNYDETVLIINSNEELENYISCTEGGYPEIDFSQHTLLLASGETASGIIGIAVKKLLQLSENEYELYIEILLNEEADAEQWIIAIIVEKVSDENTVELLITDPPCSVWECTKVQFWGGGIYDPFFELSFYPSVGKLIIEADVFIYYGGEPIDMSGIYDYYIDNNNAMYWTPDIFMGMPNFNWYVYYKSENELILCLGNYNPTMFYFACLTEFNEI